VVLARDPEHAAQLSDAWAPEHLEVQTTIDDWYLERLRNYGSLFLGQGATVAYSDKAIGTNHVLPTGRAARYTGGLWVGRFLRTLTHQRVLTNGATMTLAPPTVEICDAELMWATATASAAASPASPERDLGHDRLGASDPASRRVAAMPVARALLAPRSRADSPPTRGRLPRRPSTPARP
jgi:histidinol dehydrogenase